MEPYSIIGSPGFHFASSVVSAMEPYSIIGSPGFHFANSVVSAMEPSSKVWNHVIYNYVAG